MPQAEIQLKINGLKPFGTENPSGSGLLITGDRSSSLFAQVILGDPSGLILTWMSHHKLKEYPVVSESKNGIQDLAL